MEKYSSECFRIEELVSESVVIESHVEKIGAGLLIMNEATQEMLLLLRNSKHNGSSQ